jgi:hypothetical protein
MTDRECKVNPVSSRVCEKGTKSCTVYHNDREQLCREFTELTGGHWHEWTEYQGNKCKCGLFRYRGTDNPTYENPADVLSRLYEYLTSLQWDNFVEKCGLWHTNIVMQDPDYTTLRKPYIAMEMLIGDSLLKAAVDFLREGK